MAQLKIAILGTRGIPASYGGFETFAEELSTRLVGRGHEVTVFCRVIWPRERLVSHRSSTYRGVNLRYAFTLAHKYLETPLHAFFSNLKLVFSRYDCVLLCNAANSPFAWMIKLLGIPLVINVDGIERNRSKWNAVGKAWYRLGEWCSVKWATRIVSDAQVIARYYLEQYGVESEVIPYGATVDPLPPGETLGKFGLVPQRYILYVSRLEPENNALLTIAAYKRSKIEIPLVVVGDAPYSSDYKAKLREEASNSNVIFTGFQFGESYRELRTHCLAYVQATEVGGTHPALVEAMAYGNAIVANGTPENVEVVGDTALIYSINDQEDLAAKLLLVVNDDALRSKLGESARKRAKEQYSWESVTDSYESLIGSLGRH